MWLIFSALSTFAVFNPRAFSIVNFNKKLITDKLEAQNSPDLLGSDVEIDLPFNQYLKITDAAKKWLTD